MPKKNVVTGPGCANEQDENPMTQNDSDQKDLQEQQPSTPPKVENTDGAVVMGLERLAFKLHDLANRLLRFLPD